MVQRLVNVEAKAGLKSNIIIQNADFRNPRGYCPSQNIFIKVQTQGLTAKKFKPKEFKSKDLKPTNKKTLAPPRTNESRKIFC